MCKVQVVFVDVKADKRVIVDSFLGKWSFLGSQSS